MASILDPISPIVDAARSLFSSSAAGVSNTLGGATNRPQQFQFNYDVFPSDLGSSYYGHFMTITAITGTGAGAAGNAEYAVGLFIPSGESGSGIIYEQKHEYVDIKLTNAAGKFIGAMTGVGGLAETAAGIASYLGHPINPGVEVLYKNTDQIGRAHV